MNICLNCGSECSELLCSACNKTVDKENLITKIYCYIPGTKPDNIYYNDIWEKIAEKMSYKYNFRDLAFALAEELESPRKEYMIFRYIHKISDDYYQKDSRKWFYENVDTLLGEGISDDEKVLVYVAYLYCLYDDHRYPEAEKVAGLIHEKGKFTYSESYYLAEYYMRTRRYDIAVKLLENAISDCEKPFLRPKLEKLLFDTKQRQLGKENNGRSDYAPKSPEDKEKYYGFMETLGIAVDGSASAKKSSRGHDRMSPTEYPELPCYRDAGFIDFVAYDIETTGYDHKHESITEIGAVRVRNSVITDRFQTLVHPYKQRIRKEVTDLNGITNEDVKNAPEMWDAFNMFADFIEDDILVGFNNHTFDDKFIRRAGRYAFRVISNKSFDTMVYAHNFKDKLTFTSGSISLESCCEQLNVTNEKAHRALSDAEATAKVYLKLLEMDKGGKVSLDDILSDDDWA